MTRPPPRPAYSRDSQFVRLEDVPDLDRMSPEWAWAGSSGEQVRVAVIDSGVDADHPALEGCVDRDGGAEVHVDADEDVRLTTGPHGDAFGHGTACAGIIHSLAPAARITSVKVLDAGLSGKARQFSAGLQWAIEQRFDVINLSLGTRRADIAFELHQLCDAAYFNGTVIVTAANNVNRVSFPSLFSSVISVACHTGHDPERFHFNPAPPTEFLARGIDVDVAWRGGGRTTATGNSFAAPHISGFVARILAKHPALRPFQVKAVLWATAANVTDARQRAGRISRVMSSVAPVHRSGVVTRPTG
jgi:subtilisin